MLVPDDGMRNVGVLMGLGLFVAGCGFVWRNRATGFAMLSRSHAPKLSQIERTMESQLPIVGLIVGTVVLLWSVIASQFIEARPERYTSAFAPFAVALGLGCLSNQAKRRWLQIVTLVLVTVGAVLVAWADLSPGSEPLTLFVRALLVLAGAMFIYGGLISRWVRDHDSWLKSLREMSLVTCAGAFLCFGLVLFHAVSYTHLTLPTIYSV